MSSGPELDGGGQAPRHFTAGGWIERIRTLCAESRKSGIGEKSASSERRKETLKLFVAGDRSQVGKSTVSLGLLTLLLKCGGYRPSEIAYIKPATQCEQTQLVQKFCDAHQIDCVGIGPLVFYSGFTRAFLDGRTDSTEQILEKICARVDEISANKRFVIIDGVGYPAVGSICGCSNAVIANRLKAPVLLVGRKGVGDAVDSFNLNAAFFEHHGVTVIGALFNRLPKDGYYSLENCKNAISKYFEQYGGGKGLYGFIPEIHFEALAEKDGKVDAEVPLENELQRVTMVQDHFEKHVDIVKLIRDIRLLNFAHGTVVRPGPAQPHRRPSETTARNHTMLTKRSREDIQLSAMTGGAKGG